MPNVGKVVYQPPADVVPCRRVLSARIAEAEYDFQRLARREGR
jgi:arginyl-tRNA--protein-N-Asp/Glu arginylyltransferase